MRPDTAAASSHRVGDGCSLSLLLPEELRMVQQPGMSRIGWLRKGIRYRWGTIQFGWLIADQEDHIQQQMRVLLGS